MFKSRYLETYALLSITVLLQLHISFATHNEFAQWLWIELNVLQPCKFGLAGGCACAHVQYRRVKVDSMLMWHKITPFPIHCVSVPCNVTPVMKRSLLPGHRCSGAKVLCAGLGGHSDHWSGLACLNWSWLVAIPINVLTFWKYQRHN